MIFSQKGNALSVNVWHLPPKLEVYPVVVHGLVNMNQTSDQSIIEAEKVSIKFKASRALGIPELGAGAPGLCLQKEIFHSGTGGVH